MKNFLSQLDWRYAVKAFDPSRKVSDEDLNKILDSIRMTPTSFGLQPYKVMTIQKQDLKDQIQKVSWDQPQVGTCSYLLVFCADTDVDKHIDGYLDIASHGDSEAREKMKGYEEMMRGALDRKTPDEKIFWAQKQIYIALGFAMAACAELQVDSCPMEGFSPADLDKVLELPESLKSTVMLPIGYRDEDPTREKVRFSEEELFEER